MSGLSVLVVVVTTTLVLYGGLLVGWRHAASLAQPCTVEATSVLDQRASPSVICNEMRPASDLRCSPEFSDDQPHVFVKKLRPKKEDSILFRDDFLKIHHPNSAVNSEVILTREAAYSASDPYGSCKEIIITRTGIVRYGKPNKCAAVVQLPYNSSSAFWQSHRIGTFACNSLE
jgi:hypothetical protein